MSLTKERQSVSESIYTYLIMNGEATFKQLERKFKLKDVKLSLKGLLKNNEVRVYEKKGVPRVCINFEKDSGEIIPRVEDVIRTIKDKQPISVRNLAWELNAPPENFSHIIKPLLKENLIFYLGKRLVIPEKADKFFMTKGFY